MHTTIMQRLKTSGHAYHTLNTAQTTAGASADDRYQS